MLGGTGFASPQPDNMASMIKQMMMTSFIFKSANGQGASGNGAADYMSLIYVFIATQVIELITSRVPQMAHALFHKFFADIHKKVDTITSPIPKKKTASIIVNININDIENTMGKALMDHITNSKVIKKMYYVNQQFVLNEKEEMEIDNDIYVRMLNSSLDENQLISSEESSGSKTEKSGIIQVIEVYSYAKSSTELRQILSDMQRNYVIATQNRLGKKRFYFNMHNIEAPLLPTSFNADKTKPESVPKKDLSKLPNNFWFTMKNFETNRSFINLFGEEIDVIKRRVHFFINNKKWYDEKGIPYTLGLLLSGSPGTGKTSTIKCLANETNRHIVNINFNNDMTKNQLENLFFNEDLLVLNPQTMQNEKYSIPPNQRIYVLEDVDCQGTLAHSRELNHETENKDSNAVDLSFLLNLLDGVLETPGRIVIMTSNHPEILDKALIRPGRIDVISEFKKCSNTTITQMLEFFYDTKLTDTQRDDVCALEERIITPAEMSKVMFENFYDINQSITTLKTLSSVEKEKATTTVMATSITETTIITESVSETNSAPTSASETKLDKLPRTVNQMDFTDYGEEKVIYESCYVDSICCIDATKEKVVIIEDVVNRMNEEKPNDSNYFKPLHYERGSDKSFIPKGDLLPYNSINSSGFTPYI